MADFEQAKKFADTSFGPKFEELTREKDLELAATANRMAARGSVASSGMAFEAARIYSEMIKKVLHARAEALMEGAELHDISLDDAKDAILNELEQMKEQMVRSASASLEQLPYLRTLNLGSYMGGEVTGASNRAMGEIRANVERRRLRKKQTAASQGVTNVYHVSGHNVRFNTQSMDNSVNIVTISQQEVFTNLKQEITDKVPHGEERTEILHRLDALEQSQGSRSFAERYTDFIAVAANHMSIIAPFIPALTELMKRALGS